MIKTVLFDLDGTLIPMSQEEFINTYMSVLADTFTPMGYDGRAVVDALWRSAYAMVKNDGARSNQQVCFDVICTALGQPQEELEPLFDRFYANEFDEVRRILGHSRRARRVMDYLRSRGMGLILATNPVFPLTAVRTRVRWAGLEIEDFDYVTTYSNCSYSKPNPKYYVEIMEKNGLRPEECLMIGNNTADDMAALDAGLDAFLVTDNLENDAHTDVADYRHGSFEDMFEYCRGL